jgi:hypothetical protein
VVGVVRRAGRRTLEENDGRDIVPQQCRNILVSCLERHNFLKKRVSVKEVSEHYLTYLLRLFRTVI